MFEVSAEKKIALTQPLGLRAVAESGAETLLRQHGVSWRRVALREAPRWQA
jgi:hypothetical protein